MNLWMDGSSVEMQLHEMDEMQKSASTDEVE